MAVDSKALAAALAAYQAAVKDAQKRKVKNPQTDPAVVKARQAWSAAKAGAAKPPVKDKLDPATLAQQYGFASAVLNSDPELKALFQQALNDKTGQWTPAKFEARLRASKWYQQHSETWRQTEAVRLADPKTYEAALEAEKANIRAQAATLGAPLTEQQVTEVATNVYRMGLSAPQVKEALARYITATVPGTSLQGEAGNVEDQLRKLAYNNGMTYSDDYYRKAAAAVLGGATVDSYMDQIRQEAASRFPPYREQVLAGNDVRDLASGYINTLAQTWEVDPSDVSLDEPKIRAAFGQVNPQTGEPTAMGLWDFEKSLRADPRWMSTRNAQQQVAGAATSVLRSFGFVG